MSERFNRTDVGRMLASVNDTAKRLEMRGAGEYAVETRGGSYLYLTDRSGLSPDHTGPGTRLADLGKSWHSAGEALFNLLQAWRTVEIMRKDVA